MTFAQYKARPVGSPKCEFERGGLVPMTQPTPEHQDVRGVLGFVLRAHVKRANLGRVFMEPDIYLPDNRGYIPDIVYLSPARMHLYDTTDKCIHGAPDLAIEIISGRPSRDHVDKFGAYYENKVEWYWLVDPETLAIEEYHATDAGYLRTASVASGHEFRPQLFPALGIDLVKLLVEPSG